jgi:ribose-phosphate pyrophosphokinase
MRDKLIVTGNCSDDPFAIDMAQLLGIPTDIADMVSLKTFANSEFCPRFIPDDEDCRVIGAGLKGRTVIICSTSHATRSRSDLAMRNLILARAAKDNNADKVILVEPDLFFSAQDRGPFRFGENEKDRPDADMVKFDGQPFTALLYAQLLKAAGVDSVITVHNHSIKVQNLFQQVFEGDFHNLIPTEIYAHYIKSSNFLQTGKNGDNLVLCAPDKGATPYMNMVWDALELPDCKRLVMDKERSGERKVSMEVSDLSEIKLEDIKGKDVLILDDMVRTGTTIINCCHALREGEPHKVTFGVTHFYTSAEAREKLNSRYLDEIMTTSTLPAILNRDSQGRLRRKLVVLKVGKFISRHILQMLDLYDGRFDKDFYSIDMSSKNPRWPPPSSH